MELISASAIVLSIFYFLLSIICIYRLIKMILFKKFLKISIFFYVALFISSVSRAITMALVTIDSDTKNYNLLKYDLIVVPDLLCICSFLLLIWHLLTFYIDSHIKVANDTDDFYIENDLPNIRKVTNYVLFGLFPIYITFNVIIIILFNVSLINKTPFITIDAVESLTSSAFMVGYYIFISVKFSGRPYRNENIKGETKKIFLIVVLWSIARLIIGICELVVGIGFLNLVEEYKKSSVKQCAVIVLYYVCTEFIPFYFSTGEGLMETFKIKIQVDNDEENLISENQSIVPPDEDTTIIAINNSSEDLIGSEKENDNDNSGRRSQIPKKKASLFGGINAKEIELGDLLFSKKNGLGNIYKAIYKNEEVCCREIIFERLSRYDLEGITNDIAKLSTLNNYNITRFIGCSIENIKGSKPRILILNKLFKNGSVYDFLHTGEIKLNYQQKLHLSTRIIQGLKYLHENKIYHYHLSSKNIYFDDDLNPLIGDFGFYYLKDIANIFNEYSNKNSYSPPEILSLKGKIGKSSDTEYDCKVDVYSVGILLWEIFTNTIPFNVSINSLIDYVVNQGLRPQIPNDFDNDLTNLIRKCWDSEPKNRPDMDYILNELKNKLNDVDEGEAEEDEYDDAI